MKKNITLTLLGAIGVALAWPAAAHDRNVDESRTRTREEVRHDRDQRRMEAWERRRKQEEYEARQGGRSGPNAIGDQPYKNPRQSDKPLPLLIPKK